MDKEKNKFISFTQSLALIGFVILALASSSANEMVKDKDFQEGFRQGWEIGTQLSQDPSFKNIHTDSCSISQNPMDIALNDESVQKE